MWDTFLRLSVGYGYRPARIVPWFLGLLAAGTVVFGPLGLGHLSDRDSGAKQPASAASSAGTDRPR